MSTPMLFITTRSTSPILLFFQPERWFDGSGSGGQKLPNEAFAAFSIGVRACAGKALAYREVSLVVAQLVWYFDFEAAPGELGAVGGGTIGDKTGKGNPGEYQIKDSFSSQTDGPWLMFRERGDACRDIDQRP